jgi:acyl-CoA synthetase (NDP forming)
VDELTKTVVLYIESVKNGRRFFQAARNVGRQKPVVVLKGGRTREGNKAAASHTGAMAGNNRVFEAACRQAGVVLVDHPMDLVDISAAFSSLPLPRGKRVGITSLGGGWAVVAADLCVEYGLEIPPLSQEIIGRIDQILPPYWSRSNPIDLVGEADITIPLKVMEELMRWDGCDACLHMGIMGRRLMVQWLCDSAVAVDSTQNPALLQERVQQVIAYEKFYMESMVQLMEKYGKPILGVYLLTDEKSRTVTDVEGSPFKGVVYLTPERAIKALAKMHTYERWLESEGIPVHQRGTRMPTSPSGSV